MSALDEMKARAVSEPIKLEGTGTRIKGRLPNMVGCMIAGGVPVEILNQMKKAVAQRKEGEAEPEDDTIEEWQADQSYRREMVRQFVAEIEGTDGWEAVALTLEDVAAFDDGDRNEIYLYASRAKPLPLRT